MKQLIKGNRADIEWFCIKFPMVIVWGFIMWVMISGVSKSLYPTGICRLYSFEPLFTSPGKSILYVIIAIASLAYLLEVKMVLATFILSIVSLIVISFHESNGIFFRSTVLSPIWMVQCLAYYRYKLDGSFDLKYYRKQYVWQIIAAVYTLAGISKIYHSGIDWANGGPLFALQLVKNYAYIYFDNGNISDFNTAITMINKIVDHPAILRIMLGAALFLEIACFAVIISSKVRIIWGIGLLMMHIFIALVMGIGILSLIHI